MMYDDDVEYCVDYMKLFWQMTDVEKISICDGCLYGVLNQLGHMDKNGCLSDDVDSLEDIANYNRSLLSRTNFSNCPILR
jgi:hypothetical protein